MGWNKFSTLPSGRGVATNPFTHSLSTNDERIRNLWEGNAFSLITFYKIQSGKTKKLILSRPDGTYSVLLALYAAATGSVSLRAESLITIDDPGITGTPAPSNRNSDPTVYRDPWFSIKEDGDWTGGIEVLKQRIDPGVGVAPDDFADRATLANIPGGGAVGVEFKNLDTSDVHVNMFISWSEYLNQ
jgi:hypothetical protein